MNRILIFAFDDIYFYGFIGVYRFLHEGQPDLTFGTDGVIVTGFAKANRAMIIQADGEIIVAGKNGMSIATVKRINVDGTFDTSFNGNGSYSLINLPYS
ncbi:MAG: hypothetical protein LH473_12690, partial [Chitinophagales bacterium]|nr:hypothetical protein [Chitinophagales bacterium]